MCKNTEKMKMKKKNQPIASKKNRTVKNNMHGHAADKKQAKPMQTWTRRTSRAKAIQCRVQKKKKRCKGENVLYPLLFKRSQAISMAFSFADIPARGGAARGWAGQGNPSTSMQNLNSQRKYPWFCKYSSGFCAPSSVRLRLFDFSLLKFR
jgi:hypothetical protein